MRKKLWMALAVFILLIGIPFAYVQYKLRSAQKSVTEYLQTAEPQKDIIYNEAFIANLRGNANWMVAIKCKNDDRTYYYFKDHQAIVLESYTEDGEEEVLYKVMNKQH
ncbi:hypothetical protein [Bacillus massiliglaciei]|uniref:hypothetical protein n=1 Tax=Bacillus massiliglaciei TaxID=1816693 RepID=UPI000DA612F4|nr:hypothetical protein [Bacillus massiliglaciei]